MENGDIALPYSVAFVLKQMEDFDSENCKIDVKMTILLRIKFHGLDKFTNDDHMKEVMEHCSSLQKIRINDEEMLLNSDNTETSAI